MSRKPTRRAKREQRRLANQARRQAFYQPRKPEHRIQIQQDVMHIGWECRSDLPCTDYYADGFCTFQGECPGKGKVVYGME